MSLPDTKVCLEVGVQISQRMCKMEQGLFVSVPKCCSRNIGMFEENFQSARSHNICYSSSILNLGLLLKLKIHQMIQDNSKKTMEMTSEDGKFEDRGQRSVSVTSVGLR